MYKSLEIKNFRLFREFEIKGLERINLIVGENNIGKTSLLEALCLHQGPNNASYAFDINTMRRMVLGENPTEIWSTLDTLFNELKTEDLISISTKDDLNISRTIQISLIKNNPAKLRYDTLLKPIAEKSLEIQYSENGKSEVSSRASIVKGEIQEFIIKEFERPFVSYFGARTRTKQDLMAEWLGDLIKMKKQSLVIENLQIIEPRIRDLSILPNGSESMIWVDLGKDQLFPIYSLGDGIDRLLAISLAIANAPDGIVLIDEAENGFYYESMPKIWEVIYKMASDYNVQVFATTHSQECIYAAYEAFHEKASQDFKFFRLQRKGENIEAVGYDMETFEAALSMNLEIR